VTRLVTTQSFDVRDSAKKGAPGRRPITAKASIDQFIGYSATPGAVASTANSCLVAMPVSRFEIGGHLHLVGPCPPGGLEVGTAAGAAYGEKTLTAARRSALYFQLTRLSSGHSCQYESGRLKTTSRVE